ncbi:MAG: hypothetical protein ACRDQH_09640 [Pseudonocardiaceae bacterium]
MWRFALSRRWWLGHVLVVLCCGSFIGLGRWQWDRSQSPTGGWQNFGYALQWPLFAVVLLAAWARFLWLEQHRDLQPDSHPLDPETGTVLPTVPPDLVSTDPSSANVAAREDDPDDELAAYNAYLSRLAEQDRQ